MGKLTTNVYTSDYGTIDMPQHISDKYDNLPRRKDGQPDRRFKASKDFEDQEFLMDVYMQMAWHGSRRT